MDIQLSFLNATLRPFFSPWPSVWSPRGPVGVLAADGVVPDVLSHELASEGKLSYWHQPSVKSQFMIGSESRAVQLL